MESARERDRRRMKKFGRKTNNKTKNIMKKTIIIAALVCAAKLYADTFAILPFSLSGSILVNSPSYTSGNVWVAPAPTKYTFNTKSLLLNLAQAEYYNLNYDYPTFPSGSQIVYYLDLTHSSDFDNGIGYSFFAVVDKYGNFLCDVSDVLSLDWTKNPYVENGQQNIVTGLYSKYAQLFYGEISYDDTLSGGSQAYELDGLFTFSRNDTPNNSTGIAKLKIGLSMPFTGAGYALGSSATVTGSASASGTPSVAF
jgi:hypothetical protein